MGTLILGPCPCKVCGQPLWWGRRNGLLMWVGRDGRKHACPA